MNTFPRFKKTKNSRLKISYTQKFFHVPPSGVLEFNGKMS